MTTSTLTGVALVVISFGSLWLAAFRLTSTLSPRGLERGLATATVVAAATVAQALGLGVVGLSSPAALTACSVVAAAMSLLWLPRPQLALRDELSSTWSGLDPPVRALVGALSGVVVAWACFAVLRPTLDFDSTFYNLAEVSRWVRNGDPGSVDLISARFPIGDYPSTNEVLMTWLASVSQNMGVVLLWPLMAGALLVAGTVTTLRELRCERWVIALAALSLALIPIVTEAYTSLDSDLPSTAWVAVTTALCARVATRTRRPSCSRSRSSRSHWPSAPRRASPCSVCWS